MKKYFISDLHLGDGSEADDFQHRQLFNQLLDKILKENESQLVLVGDFLELWQSHLERILYYYHSEFEKLFELARNNRLIYVYGNHDYLPFYRFEEGIFGNIKIEEEYTLPGSGIKACHGHQYDPFNKLEQARERIKAPLGKKIAEVVGLLEKHIDRDTDKFLGNLFDDFNSFKEALQQKGIIEGVVSEIFEKDFQTNQKKFPQEILSIQSRKTPGDKGYPLALPRYPESVLAELKEEPFNIGIIGHTHRAKFLEDEKNDNIYLNLGSWTGVGAGPYYALLESGEIKLIKAESNKILQSFKI